MTSPTTILPTLSAFDVERAIQLIQSAYAPQGPQTLPSDQQRLQQDLFDIQKRPEAWGLVIPFLEHPDPNVQFFGAHTAQVKIVRDWDAFPEENRVRLRDLLLDLTASSITADRNKVILRKLFVALSSIAIKLVPLHPTQWPDWILASVTYFSGRSVATEHILDFLSITAEEIDTADLLGSNKGRMKQSLQDAVPIVVQAVTASISETGQSVSKNELQSALKCLEAWMSHLRGDDLISLIPLLISLLGPASSFSSEPQFDDAKFIPASDALQEVMTKSALSDGSGSKSLTEPLMLWLARWGGSIIDETLRSGSVDEISHSLCKLLVAIGDHSTSYIAANLASTSPITSSASIQLSSQAPGSPPTKGHLIQTFLKLLMAYTTLPGFYGQDEDESEMTLGFWFLLQEALWSTEYHFEELEGDAREQDNDGAPWDMAKAVYTELVCGLRQKVVWPIGTVQKGWTKDQNEKFRWYRRDVGDTLINAYYILRNDMLGYYVNDVKERLSVRQDHEGWEETEATLHCMMSVQEAVPLEDNAHLELVFGPEILAKLPTTGHDRVRRTALRLIGVYASWFTTHPKSLTPSLLMGAISYVVAALSEHSLCLDAANALRDLCDANRTALAPHIGAFGEIYAGLSGIPDTEKSKVLQSIASVIQAMPPEDEITPIETIVSPVVAKLMDALQSSAQLPEEARSVAILQLQTLTGVAKGLTRMTDPVILLEEPSGDEEQAARLRNAYEDSRMINLRTSIFTAIRGTVDLWSMDASVSDALSDFIKSTTSLPSDITLLSLPPGPLLELVCSASQRHLTSVWLSLASMLIIQLDPPSILPTTLKIGPTPQAEAIVSNVLPVLLQTSLAYLGQPGSMESNPDIVQAFFGCMEPVARHFLSSLYKLPPDGFDALMQCAISSLALQERYSLVSAATFLGTLLSRTSSVEELAEAKAALIRAHGRSILRAILCGFAGVAPRSVVPNLIDLLSAMVTQATTACKAWMRDILFADDFVPSQAGPEAKDRFIKAVMSSRSSKRTREAAQQFTIIARGLEGSSFGYATISM